MVITPGHSQPILFTSFEGDFSLTLGLRWTTFSFSFYLLLFICHFGDGRAAVGEVAEFTHFHCLALFVLMAMPAASWKETCWTIWLLCPYCRCQTCTVSTVRVCMIGCFPLNALPICCLHFKQDANVIGRYCISEFQDNHINPFSLLINNDWSVVNTFSVESILIKWFSVLEG